MNILTSTSAEMDTRFQDNLSPEPSNISDISHNCFKTPNITTFNSLLSLNSGLYPTPPSDNEDHYQQQQNSFYTNYYESIGPTNTNTYQQSPELAKNLYQANLYSSPESSTCSIQNQDQVPRANVQTTSQRYKRRSRTTFSKSQLDILEKTFQKSQYPEIKTVDDLCDLLHLSTERVSIWFQNRRARFKKQRKIQAQNTGYATKDLEKTLKLPSNNNYQASVPTTNKYEYENRMYPMAYATVPHFYTDSVQINKIENANTTDENTTESVYGTSPSTPILNHQFYPQQSMQYYDTTGGVHQTYAYHNNLSI